MHLSPEELREIRRSHVFVKSTVILATSPNRPLLLAGTESGGGARKVGHYCGYVRTGEQKFTLARDVPSLDRNGLHRRVFAPDFVRYELFRYESDCVHFMVTDLSVDSERRMIRSRTLFYQRHGRLANNSALFVPVNTGAKLWIPDSFLDGFRAALEGTRTLGCRRAVFGGLPTSPSTAVTPATTVAPEDAAAPSAPAL